MRNGTILMLHIIPNRKLQIISFRMTCNVAVCTVGINKSVPLSLNHHILSNAEPIYTK